MCALVWFAELFSSLLRFWESAIPKADTSPPALIVNFISNRVIQQLRRSAESGTPLGNYIGMITENHHTRTLAPMAAQPAWRFLAGA